MMSIVPVKAFNDNYIWMIVSGKQVLVIDPGDASVVIDYLTAHHLILHAILMPLLMPL